MATIGYIRVSTIDQNIDLQRNALTSANCDRIFEDRISGQDCKPPRPETSVKVCNKGDTLVVWKLDRLGPQREKPGGVNI
ncbi:DNA-invertase [Salmonella enterica]|uniref:DNA-invertase n=1 Tax=Salmonella sp. NCTC 6947 TaxID=2583581 RepID=A0A509BPM1_9ENTR|nr:DNA-invertase [Salmonella enterica]